MKTKIKLGQKGKDKITGFEGIIIGKITWMFGCDQYAISPPKDKDGKMSEVEWLDEGRIAITGNGILPKDVKVEKNGGINRDCPKVK